MVEPLRHRQTKGAETDMPGLQPLRQTSTLPTAADFHTIRDGPQPEAAIRLFYSMTSSARARIKGGIVRPRALAVLRLMTSSILTTCWTGRSAGAAPLRILAL